MCQNNKCCRTAGHNCSSGTSCCSGSCGVTTPGQCD
jgi:hypothetical protein